MFNIIKNRENKYKCHVCCENTHTQIIKIETSKPFYICLECFDKMQDMVDTFYVPKLTKDINAMNRWRVR